MATLVKKIDIHVHTAPRKGLPRYCGSDGSDYCTPTELRTKYDAMGIEKGVILPSLNPECNFRVITNEMAAQMAADFPETFYWFCNIDPRYGTNSAEMDFTPFINYYKALGAKGVGEVCANLYFDDPMVLNLFKHCEANNMPVIFHIGGAGGGDYGLIDEIGLPRLEKALQMFPKLQFLGHSQKFWAEISADVTEESRYGFPTGKVIPGRVVELMRKYPNLSCDLSAGSGGNAMMRDPEFGYAFIEEFQDRLYYGTDFCSPHNVMPLGDWLDKAVEEGKISQVAYEKIVRENALKLLNREM